MSNCLGGPGRWMQALECGGGRGFFPKASALEPKLVEYQSVGLLRMMDRMLW
jgi:hypothetical protein